MVCMVCCGVQGVPWCDVVWCGVVCEVSCGVPWCTKTNLIIKNS